MEQDSEDRFLALWIEGNITEEEVLNHVSIEELATYKKINTELSTWSIKAMDKKSSFEKLKERRGIHKEAKVVKINSSKRWLSIAASVIVLIGAYLIYQTVFISSILEIETTAGETQRVELPDGSVAFLNSSTKLSLNKATYLKDRQLSLEGQAYFEVKTGEKFDVNFNQGKVSVLGTKFDVSVRKGFQNIKCFEGKVSVASFTLHDSTILTKGKAVQFSINQPLEIYEILDTSPHWMSGVSKFKNAKLSQVIFALEAQFDHEFLIDTSLDINRKFSGAFVHSDLDLALKMVFDPLDLTYKITEDKVILK